MTLLPTGEEIALLATRVLSARLAHGPSPAAHLPYCIPSGILWTPGKRECVTFYGRALIRYEYNSRSDTESFRETQRPPAQKIVFVVCFCETANVPQIIPLMPKPGDLKAEIALAKQREIEVKAVFAKYDVDDSDTSESCHCMPNASRRGSGTIPTSYCLSMPSAAE